MLLFIVPLLQQNKEILTFYGWWQFAVCLFAFVSLLSIWWHIGQKQNDFGQVWLALSVLCWSFSGLAEVYFAKIQPARPFLLEGWRSLLSLFNSLFILLALPWFRFLPKTIEPIIKSKHWKIIVGLPFLFSFLPTVNKMISGRTITIISELDVYYAFLTLIFLGIVLWESFAKRRLKLLAWLSMACITITLIAQCYKLMEAPVNQNLFSAIFKTCLIMIFFALALSWVKELSENILPPVQYFKLNLKRQKNKGKQHFFVVIKGISGKEEQKIKLTPNAYKLLYKFAENKKLSEDSWLEIKPKNFSKSQRVYDIQDYNEVKRLLLALLDGIFGKGNWTKEHHMLPLKNLLFEMSEKRERKIRLAVPADNISL
ncbi:hypothetical protein [Costertonia aggregata]|uniref:Histidine kinase N-terminal 7TM region domain-containing protein n=1 Tax=Costertonia aggregata TaxID=343403 RepID=A0A7H9AKN3_9FLAO|nr:hypothetical protein [Costertonia aggregata]QLG44046.1 hypothetical protein HYG79_01330 [Costertonia aggregata]